MCGEEFESTQANTKFCSNNCKSKYRRMEGTDNVEAECVVCGKKFVKNKYSKKENTLVKKMFTTWKSETITTIQFVVVLLYIIVWTPSGTW